MCPEPARLEGRKGKGEKERREKEKMGEKDKR
jgi:hypothetical protein